MDDRLIQFRVGVVVVAATLITGVLIMLFGEGWRGRQYTIYVRFPKAPGIAVDTPVRKNGVLIGRVTRVELPEAGGVLVTARIDRKRILRTNEVCRISTASIIGDAVLDFVPSGVEEAAPRQIEDGEFMSGVVAGDPLQVLVDMQGKMSSALDSVDKAGNRIALLAERLDTVLGANEGQIQRVVQKSELALDSFRDAAGHIDEMVGDPQFQKQLKGALQNLPQVLGEARQMLGDARTTLQNFDKMSQRAEHNLANLEKFTEPLGASGPEMVQSVSRSLRSLDEVLAQAVQFSQGLSSSQGSLGKLVTDPTLYNKLDRAADNIEDITRRLRPVLEDVRVFTDKIATDPRQLGVKGALSSRPSGFGLKSSLWQTW